MIYHLFQYLERYDIPGQHLFNYLSFRAMFTSVLAMLISFFIGRKIISWLQRKQIGETIRDLGLEGQMQKKGTPTMGGVIIIAAISAANLKLIFFMFFTFIGYSVTNVTIYELILSCASLPAPVPLYLLRVALRR